MSEDFAVALAARIRAAFEAAADPAKAGPMTKYTRDLFPFLGLPSPVRRQLQRAALVGLANPLEADVVAAAEALWRAPEREYQYAACDLLGRHEKLLGPGFLATAERLITTKSWWETVDALASLPVGSIVARNAECVATMDRWIESENTWLARAALIHQLRYREATDVERLFRYCLLRAPDREFFIRKAIGWALRQYSWTAPTAVAAFVSEHASELPGLSKREAMLVINGGRKGGPADRVRRTAG